MDHALHGAAVEAAVLRAALGREAGHGEGAVGVADVLLEEAEVVDDLGAWRDERRDGLAPVLQAPAHQL